MATPISPEHAVYNLPAIAGATIRPDGQAIAFTRVTIDKEKKKPVSHVWLCDVDGGNRRQLTRVGTGNGDPAWSPDGAVLAYVTEREGDKPHGIALMPFDGGEPRILVSHAARPGDLQWSPDGKIIAYSLPVDPDNPNETPRDPEEAPKVRVTRRVDYKQDGLGYIGDTRSQVFVLDVDSGESKQLTHSPHHIMRARWSPDGLQLVAVTPYRGGIVSRLALIDASSGEITPFGPDDAMVGLGSWSPDGSRIFSYVDTDTIFHFDLHVFDVASRTSQKVGDTVPFTAAGFYFSTAPAVWLSDTEVLVPGSTHGKSGLWISNVETGALRELGVWEANVTGTSVSADRKRLVATTDSIHGYGGLTVIDLETGARTDLYDEHADFAQEAPFATWEEVSVDRGDFTVHGWLYKPADFDERKKYPIVLDIHGGPQGAYGFGLNIFAQVSATNGFLTLLCNPRGSTDYGKEFTSAALHDWGGEDWKDLEALLDMVCERPYVDADRAGVYGYSYGGYMTSWILGHTTRFKAAVCGAPVFNLVSMYGSSDLGYNFLTHQIGGTPWTNFDAYVKHSPITYIDKATTPTLVVCGESDDRCPIGQSEELFIALSEHGVETEFARYPGGAHPFIVAGPPDHRIDFLQRYIDWFRKFLGDPA